jgi:hypothetical protein
MKNGEKCFQTSMKSFKKAFFCSLKRWLQIELIIFEANKIKSQKEYES